MTPLIELKKQFEESNAPNYGGAKLKFSGVDSYTVYNPSIPFVFDGKRYMFGRVEKINEYAASKICLFEDDGGVWKKCGRFGELPLEDPFITLIAGELVLGGVFVEKENGCVKNYYCKFFRGGEPFALKLFARGPDNMKDIRLVELENGKIGCFSRPRNDTLIAIYGSEAMIGYTEIDKLDLIEPSVIENARLIDGVFGPCEWGGPNQVYALDDGLVGIIGHQSANDGERARTLGYDFAVYVNTAFVFCPKKFSFIESKIIATRASYPAGAAKKKGLADCAFSAGAVAGEDGKVLLYSGLNDCEAGYVRIDDPFKEYGGIKKCSNGRFAL